MTDLYDRLGAHTLFLLLLCKVLRDRIKDDDCSGDLVMNILEVCPESLI